MEPISRAPEDALRRKVKDEIRFRMRQVRKALPAAVRADRAARIHATLFAREEWKRAKVVMLFASMRTEVDTLEMERRARAEGKTVVCPRMSEDRTELDPRVWVEGVVPYEQGRLAPEPPPDAPSFDPADIDLVVVPALALDPNGARIGYGKGFYDRFLARTPARRIAVAFDFQLIAEVPETEGDQRVHTIVTDQRVIDVP
jgi:5-formyltetrahydrofolate cyclo-ligase